MVPVLQDLYRFDEFELQLSRRTLLRGGERLALAPRLRRRSVVSPRSKPRGRKERGFDSGCGLESGVRYSPWWLAGARSAGDFENLTGDASFDHAQTTVPTIDLTSRRAWLWRANKELVLAEARAEFAKLPQ